METLSARRRSFVLRVWIDDASGEMRGYLSDVRTNVRRPFREIADLPPLIHSLFDRLAERDD